MTKKEEFLLGFDNLNNTILEVKVEMPNCPEYETIINHRPNFNAKKEYYTNAYNDNLELISFPSIKIIEYRFFTFEEFPRIEE